MIRLAGLSLTAISNGNGASLLAGEVEVEAGPGIAILNVGLGRTAGADFELQLPGSFTAASFTLSGADLMLRNTPISHLLLRHKAPLPGKLGVDWRRLAGSLRSLRCKVRGARFRAVPVGFDFGRELVV